MLNALILFAQAVEEKSKDAAPDGVGSLFSGPMPYLIAIMALFFFLIILPAQRRQRREQEQILANMKKNDEVVTHSGIIGIVANIKEGGDEVTLKVDDNARIRVLKSSIARIINKKEEAKDAAAPASPPAANTNVKPNA